MGRNYSITDVYNWKFKSIEMPEEWTSHLGQITHGFRMLIEGPSGHGKSDYLMKMIKMFCQTNGKVCLNNVEQGKSSSLEQSYKRNNMIEVKGKLMLCERKYRDFEAWFKYLEGPNRGKTIALDSLDYMKLRSIQKAS
jgi:archaellum biogenesis ATPase FlaH